MAIVGAYALNSFAVITSESFLYQFFNFTGAIGITYISFKRNAYQPGVLNAIWTIIALIAMIKIIF